MVPFAIIAHFNVSHLDLTVRPIKEQWQEAQVCLAQGSLVCLRADCAVLTG